MRTARLQPAGEDQPDVALEASQREGERTHRPSVEPLDVVDRDDDRLPLAQQAEHIAYGHGDRAVVGGLARGFVEEECDPQGAPSRRGERANQVVEDAVEKVSEPDVCEVALGLGGTRRENIQATPACGGDSCEP